MRLACVVLLATVAFGATGCSDLSSETEEPAPQVAEQPAPEEPAPQVVRQLAPQVARQPAPQVAGDPTPYVAGQPGFRALDNYNHDSKGNRVTNEDKVLIRNAIQKFTAAQQRRKSGY